MTRSFELSQIHHRSGGVDYYVNLVEYDRFKLFRFRCYHRGHSALWHVPGFRWWLKKTHDTIPRFAWQDVKCFSLKSNATRVITTIKIDKETYYLLRNKSETPFLSDPTSTLG